MRLLLSPEGPPSGKLRLEGSAEGKWVPCWEGSMEL